MKLTTKTDEIEMYEPPIDMTAEEAADYAAALNDRDRHCCVCGNGDDSFHLLLVDDGGGSIFVDRIVDEECARWVAALINQALAHHESAAGRLRARG